MVINWFTLLCGLFFGLISTHSLINSECRYLRFDALWHRVVNPRKVKQRRRWWKMPIVWIDPFRGYVAASLLRTAFEVQPGSGGFQRLLPLGATFLVLLIILCVQTTGRKAQGEIISPSSFLAGMMIALLPWIVALSAIVVGLASAVALNRYIVGYLVASLATAVIGYPFINNKLWLVAATLLVATPLFLSWLGRRSLVMPVRA